jgi:GAF domain-containing protein
MPFQPRPELIKSLQAIAEDIFETTKPGRVTIRVDVTNDPDYPVLAEARAPGVSSITGGITLVGYKPIDIHKAATFAFLRDERKKIVQRDVRVDPPQIPQLLDFYGCLSQVLTPISWQGRFVGALSVHAVEPRDWTEEDVAAIEEATGRVESELEQAAWFDLPR